MRALLLAALVLGAGSPVIAATFYLKTDGDDAKDCSTAAKACSTLERVYSLTSEKPIGEANDEILIAEGEYKPEPCQLEVGHAVTFKGGYTPDFQKQQTDSSKTLLTLNGDAGYCRLFAVHSGPARWLKLENMTLTGVTDPGSHSGVILTYTPPGEDPNLEGGWIELTNIVIKDNYFLDGEGKVAGGGSGAIRMQVPSDKLVIKNSIFSSNTATLDGGAIAIFGGDADISSTRFIGNKASTGGAIYSNNSTLTLKEVEFINNTSEVVTAQDGSWGGGAINAVSTSLTIDGALFEGNATNQRGGAIFLEFQNTEANILNATFYGNQSGDRAGAIANKDAVLSLKYSTLYNNQATTFGGGLVVFEDDAQTELLANLILNNKGLNSGSDENVVVWKSNIQTVDLGFNIFGYDNESGLKQVDASLVAIASDQNTIFGTTLSTTLATDTLSDVLADVDGPVDNGGIVKTIRIVKGGPAYDQVPNDAADFYGRGQSADYPFRSLQEAHSAMNRFDYDEGRYYFNLDLDKDGTPDDTHVFSTIVDEKGYVLIASADKSTQTNTFNQVTDLGKQSDSILNAALLGAIDVDEVRLQSSSGASGAFDAFTLNKETVDRINDNATLKTNGTGFPNGDGGWVVTVGDQSVMNATCNSGGGLLTNMAVFQACGNTGGLHWVGGYEQVDYEEHAPWTDTTQDDLNLWVRSHAGLCDSGAIKTDARGLPRSDFQNPDDPAQNGPAHSCDIGAFEFNDGYQFDCYDEDGKRPENDLDLLGGTGSAGVCFGGDITKATPKALLNNIGSINPFFLIVVALPLFFRRKYS